MMDEWMIILGTFELAMQEQHREKNTHVRDYETFRQLSITKQLLDLGKLFHSLHFHFLFHKMQRKMYCIKSCKTVNFFNFAKLVKCIQFPCWELNKKISDIISLKQIVVLLLINTGRQIVLQRNLQMAYTFRLQKKKYKWSKAHKNTHSTF